MKEHLGRIKLAAFVLAAVLAVFSIADRFFDFSSVAQPRLWTQQQAEEWRRASIAYKELAYQVPGRSGLTEEEIAQQRERAKQRFEALQSQLEAATARPRRWRRFLLLSAVACVGVGLACHFADHDDR